MYVVHGNMLRIYYKMVMFSVQQPEPSPPPVQNQYSESPPQSRVGGPLPMQPGWLPRWLSGEVAPPKVYMQVEEAVTV